RVELDPVAVALAHRGEQVAVVIERQPRIEAAVEGDEVASELDQLVDFREHLLAREHVAAVLVREHVEGAVIALSNADVRVIDDPHHHVRGAVRLVPASAHLLRELLQLVVGGLVPERPRLVDRDAPHAGTKSSVSMNELTEKTALPGPAG